MRSKTLDRADTHTVQPKLFGIVNDLPDQSTTRNLTLITKIIQALANLNEFGVKEPYMVPVCTCCLGLF